MIWVKWIVVISVGVVSTPIPLGWCFALLLAKKWGIGVNGWPKLANTKSEGIMDVFKLLLGLILVFLPVTLLNNFPTMVAAHRRRRARGKNREEHQLPDDFTVSIGIGNPGPLADLRLQITEVLEKDFGLRVFGLNQQGEATLHLFAHYRRSTGGSQELYCEVTFRIGGKGRRETFPIIIDLTGGEPPEALPRRALARYRDLHQICRNVPGFLSSTAPPS